MTAAGLSRRPVPSEPSLEITRSGDVYASGRRLASKLSRRGSYGIPYLTVQSTDGEWKVSWVMLSETWYESGVLIPRNGEMLNMSPENVICIRQIAGKVTHPMKIQAIWCRWKQGMKCSDMPGSLFTYEVDDFKSVVRQVFEAGLE